MVRSQITSALCALIVLQPSQVFAAKACYDNNHNQVNALPCQPDSEEPGPCCGFGDICLSNGLCQPGPDIKNNGLVDTYRSSCTDQNWNTTNCFSGCNSFKGNGLKNCGNNRYCCYDMNGCDCTKTSLFNLGAYAFQTTLPLSMPTTTSAPASISATTTAASRPSQTSSTSPSPTQAEAVAADNSVAIGAGVGAGVGVPLLLAVGVLAFYLYKKRHTQAASNNGDMAYAIGESKAPVVTGSYQPVPQGPHRYTHEAPAQPLELAGMPILQEMESIRKPTG